MTEKLESKQGSPSKSPISWMARNPVAANLLKLFLLLGGLFMAFQIGKEHMPEFELDEVSIRVEYPGAGPEEVEQGVVLPVENAIRAIDGVQEVTATAAEDWGTVRAELARGVQRQEVFQDIEQEVNRIRTFPEEAEDPRVQLVSTRRDVLTVGIYGSVSQIELRETTEKVRNYLEQQESITQVELDEAPDHVLHLDIPEETLRRYGLSLAEIANRVRQSSQDIPGGSVETHQGELLLRVKERKEIAREFTQIPIISTKQGSVLHLGDIASVYDGFEDTRFLERFEGLPALSINIYRIGQESPLQVESAAKQGLEEIFLELPEEFDYWISRNRAESYDQRISLLLKNAMLGGVLVLLLLTFFIGHRLTFWVLLGMTAAILGAFLLLPGLGVTFNMISMFAFLIVIGLVVDDAIVAGENIYAYREQGHSAVQASILGAHDICKPLTFSIMTTCAAFLPLMFVPGMMGQFFAPLPLVVICVLLLSLIDALFILPAHLSHSALQSRTALGIFMDRWQVRFSQNFRKLVCKVFQPFLAACLSRRYLSIAVAFALLLAVIGYALSDRMAFRLMPERVADEARATAELPPGSTLDRSKSVARQLEESARRLIQEHGGPELATGVQTRVRGNTVHVEILLTHPDLRPLSMQELTSLWREKTGQIPGLERLRFRSRTPGPVARYQDITIELNHQELTVLEESADQLVQELNALDSSRDVSHDFREGSLQLDFSLTRIGRSLGFDPEMIGHQVRDSFHGALVKRFIRGENEVEVRARLPEEQTYSQFHIENLMLSAPRNGYVPLGQVADIEHSRAYSEINRRDNRRIVTVSADVVPDDQLAVVRTQLSTEIMPALQEAYPGLNWEFGGEHRDIQEAAGALSTGALLALGGIYLLLAVAFRSYLQPFVIMSAIPFGIFGAIVGHILLGFSFSIISAMGMVALSGVLINASLLMLDYANKRRPDKEAFTAIVEAAVRRFRPILLTTLTTFGALAPLIFETSVQAKFMIPMAISLGFGILFATGIILIIVPCFYLVVEDLLALKAKLKTVLIPEKK